MSNNCVVPGCRSSFSNNDFNFKFPSEEKRLADWINKIFEATGVRLDIQPSDRICGTHFDESSIVRYAQTYSDNKLSDQNSRLCLTRDAVPIIFRFNSTVSPSDESQSADSKETKALKKEKRGSCGYANLQKARMKKQKRKERMRSLMQQRAQLKSKTGVTSKEKKLNQENSLENDYFLGNRHQSTAEKLIIQLRLPALLQRLHEGENLCKKPPESITDTKAYPTFDIIHNIIGLFEGKRNPIEWSVLEASRFVRYVSTIAIAKTFRSEDIDGEALLNLTKADLINHLRLAPETADKLFTTFTNLRSEVIKRFINV